MKKLLYFFVIVSILLASCGGKDATDTPAPEPTEAPAATQAPEPTEAPVATEPPPPEEAFRVGYVTDTGGIDDKSFNTNQWEGIQRAVQELGIEAQFIQSDEATQYEANITEFASQGYDLVFASGFFLGGDLAKVAAQYPDIKFSIVDYTYPDPFGVPEGVVGNAECVPNVQGQIFKTDQAAFLAGYLAAGMTKTGRLGYFGGAKIPTVTIFGVGFQAGMEYYNEVHGTDVELIGWDNETGEGLFTGDFIDLTKGKEATESLFDEGADIFIPVGGLIGSPGFAVARERGGYGIWVDVDGYNLLPEESDVMLTSVMKKMDNSVFHVIKDTLDGFFDGCGVYIGSLANGGVGIAPYHDLESAVPDDLKAEVAALEQQIISGEIADTGCLSYPEHCPGGLYEVVAEPEAAADCTEDLTGETFVFYSQAGLTGALSTILGTSFVNALNDSIADLNDAGGICGAMVELDLVDTQYEAEQEIAAYQVNREKDPKPLAIATYGSAASIALKDMVIEDQIVNFAAGLNAMAFYVPRNGYTVGVAPIYSDQFAGFLQFLSENWDDIKPEGAGDEIVVGVVGWEGPFGAGATTPEALAYAESLGITVLELETYAVSAEADLVTPLQSLAVQGANVIYVQSLGFGAAQAIGTLRALDMWDSVVVGGNVWAINTDVLTVLGDSAPAMIGFYGMFPWKWWNDTDVPGVQQALAAFERGGYPDADKGVSYISSYAGTFAWAEIIKHAISRVGYANLDGAAFFEAFQDLGTVSALGIFEYDVRGENRSPRQSQVRQVQLVDGAIEFVVVEDFFELPDMRPPAE